MGKAQTIEQKLGKQKMFYFFHFDLRNSRSFANVMLNLIMPAIILNSKMNHIVE